MWKEVGETFLVTLGNKKDKFCFSSNYLRSSGSGFLRVFFGDDACGGLLTETQPSFISTQQSASVAVRNIFRQQYQEKSQTV